MKKSLVLTVFIFISAQMIFSQNIRTGERESYQGEWFQGINFEWWSKQEGNDMFGGYGTGNGLGRIIYTPPNLVSVYDEDNIILNYALYDYIKADDDNPEAVNYLLRQDLYDDAQYWLINDVDKNNQLLFNLIEWKSQVDETVWSVLRINYQASDDIYRWLDKFSELEVMDTYLDGTWAADSYMTLGFSDEYSYQWDIGTESNTFKITEPGKLQWITEELETFDYTLRKETAMIILNLEKNGESKNYYVILPLTPNELILVQGAFKKEWFDEFDILFFTRK